MKIINSSPAAYLSVSSSLLSVAMKRRYWLRKDETKQLAREAEKFGGDVEKLLQKGVELLELGDDKKIVLAGGKGLFIRSRDELFPTLHAVELLQLRRVVIDMGAVPHVANGADVMGPGVVSADAEIKAGDAVAVVDERHRKPLAIGLALVPGAEMRAPKGKVVKSIHYVGDEVWQFLQEKVKYRT
jgi:PUA-domain protein